MHKTLPALLSLPLLAACGQLMHQNALTLSVEEAEGAPFAQGRVHTLKFTVTNSSAWVVLLTELEPISSDEEPRFGFQRAAAGTIAASPTGEFVHDPAPAQITPRFFNEGLLLPGRSVSFLKAHRVLEPTERFRLHYTAVDTPRGLSDLSKRVFVPAGGGRYPPSTEESLNALAAAAHPPVGPAGTPSPRAVIFPQGAAGVRAGDTALLFRHDDLEVSFGTPKPLPMSREQAGQRAGISDLSKLGYSEALAAWIVPRGGTDQIVPVGGGEAWTAAAADAEFYRDLDRAGRALVAADDPAAFTALGFAAAEGNPRLGGAVKLVAVPREKAADFLRHPAVAPEAGRGSRVATQYYYFDEHYFKIERP
jgi:hypothetical protein